jgi:hypothetical protein
MKAMCDEAALRTFKSSAQGAATTVYAAVSWEWSYKGGRYLSSCMEQRGREERRGKRGCGRMRMRGMRSGCMMGRVKRSFGS